MSPGLQLDADAKRGDSVVNVLAVSPNRDDLAALHEILNHSNWVLREARSCRQAVDELRNEPAGVIVCEHSLPDGSWRDVHRAASGLEPPPPVVVSSLHADDRMWAEVLNLGGYDVLPEPFDRNEVVRILSLAWLHWKDHCRRTRRPQGRVMAMAATA
ncbi:MAG: response regulator [Bryobacterales bacterium]|nr:response regulator [Bryobacterales bacterium]